MRVLLSIRPEYAEKILNGSKRFEYRRVVFRRCQAATTVVIYATMPVGMVVGEFDVDGILTGDPAAIWAQTHAGAGISRTFFDRYFSGRAVANAIRVAAPRRYVRPRRLCEVSGSVLAPQSFRYLEE